MAFGFSTFSGAPFADLGSVSITINVTGVEATGAVGTVSVVAKAVVSPTGVSATGYIGNVLVWGQIVPNQTPNWQNINDSQTPGWQLVNDGNTVVWVEVIT